MTVGPRPRLADVAAHAGVSMKTVSNVVNGYVHVSAAMRTRVQASIDALGYRPNLTARNLASGRSGVIELVVPRLDMPYFAALAGQVLLAARADGAVVLIQQTLGDAAAERAVLQQPPAQRIDGMIFSPTRLRPADLRDRALGGPLVLLGEQTFPGLVDHVGIDNRAAARAAVEHLIMTGRRRIAMIGPGPGDRRNLRLAGYRDALAAHGLGRDDDLVLPARGNTGEEAETALDTLLQRRPAPTFDAIFCATDWLALGALRTLRRRGLSVPDDVAVVGFDDIPYGRASSPSLTTITPDRPGIARLALHSLHGQADAAREPRDQHADFTLTVRESAPDS